jgi:hypothetical protein
MSRHLDPGRRFQRHLAVRLRRETWGGIAFHRGQGDLMELDEEGFDAVAALARAQTLPDLQGRLRTQGHPARLPELAEFVCALEARGIVRRVTDEAPELPPDPWSRGAAPETVTGLRAPIVAH